MYCAKIIITYESPRFRHFQTARILPQTAMVCRIAIRSYPNKPLIASVRRSIVKALTLFAKELLQRAGFKRQITPYEPLSSEDQVRETFGFPLTPWLSGYSNAR